MPYQYQPRTERRDNGKIDGKKTTVPTYVIIMIVLLIMLPLMGILAPKFLSEILGFIFVLVLILLSIAAIFFLFSSILKKYEENRRFGAKQKAKGLEKYKGRWGTPAEVEKWREEDRYKALPTITEIKCTCNQCGKIWHYLPSEKKGSVSSDGCGGCVTCSGCLLCNPIVAALGLLLSSSEKTTKAAEKLYMKKVDECPNCHSKNFKKEVITYKKDEKISN